MAVLLQLAIALPQAKPERIWIIFPDFIPQFKIDRVLDDKLASDQQAIYESDDYPIHYKIRQELV